MTRLMMIKIAMTMIGEVNDDCQRQDDHNAFTQSIIQIYWERITDPCK